MSAYFIVTVTVKDGEKFKEYGAQAIQTIKDFGGQPIIRGKMLGVLTNGGADQNDHSTSTVVKFPSLQALDDWYNSDSYQAIIPLRDEAADVTITKYEEVV